MRSKLKRNLDEQLVGSIDTVKYNSKNRSSLAIKLTESGKKLSELCLLCNKQNAHFWVIEVHGIFKN